MCQVDLPHTRLLSVICTLLLALTLGPVEQLQALNNSQDLGWIWIGGNSIGNQPAVITQTKTTAGEVIDLQPGARDAVASWSNKQGQLWLFGGKGFDDKPTHEPHCLDDLWTFNASTEEWTLVSSAGLSPVTTVKSQPRHVPKARHSGVLCGVDSLLLVLFGGEDYRGDKLSDTWIFEIHQSKWIPMFVKAHRDQNATDHPPGRIGAAHWCLKDRLIIFGGVGQHGQVLDDLWQFSLRNLQWGQLDQFSQIDKIDRDNSPYPAARHGAATWVSKQGALYMFAGSSDPQTSTIDQHESAGFLSDMWKYEVTTQTWVLVDLKQGSAQPGARQHSPTFTKDGKSLWLYGGQGKNTTASLSIFLSDLWLFNLSSNSWTLVDDNKAYVNQSVYFKQKYTVLKHVPVTPRCGSVVWWHKNITYLFGGFGRDGRHHITYLNDQWVLLRGDPTHYIARRVMLAGGSSWIKTLSPGKIFFIVFCGFGTLVLLVGAVCFFKKMLERPRHGPISEFSVKYSKLRTEEPAL